MTVLRERTAIAGPVLPPFSRGPVLAIAAAVALTLTVLSGRFGYFGDELYFVAAGRHHLSWSYADNPWLLPFLARTTDILFPGSVAGLRSLAMLATVGGVVITALTAREFGGGRHAQILACGAYALSVQILASGHILATSTVDPFLWTLITWLLVRWVRIRQDSLLLAAGLATAVTMQGKFLIAIFWLALGIAVLAAGPREMLQRPALWLGAGITALVTAPGLVWQYEHGWPYLTMQAVVAEQVNRFMGGPQAFLPLAVLFAGPLVGSFLVCHGLWHLLRSPGFAAYRFLAWTTLLVSGIFLVTSGRYYYLAGLYSLLFAVSATQIERHKPMLWWRPVPTLPAYLAAAAITVPIALPVWPASMVTTVQFVASGSLGWPQVADVVATAQHELPAGKHAVVVTDTYWQAGALEVYGPGRHLPAVYSAERGYFYFGRPPEVTETVLHVGGNPDQLRGWFSEVRPAGVVRLAAPADNVNQGVRVWLCEHPRLPWPDLWNQMHKL